MSRFTGTDAANLKEAYASIYAYKPQWVINEETGGAVLILDEETGDYITEDYLNEQTDLFIDKLIEEEFDFSEITLEELSQKFIDYSLNEGWAQDLGAKVRGGINKASSAVKGAVTGAVNRAKDRIGATAQGLAGKRTTSKDIVSRTGNFLSRAATAAPRAAGDFVKGVVTGKGGGKEGPNLGTDIKNALKGGKKVVKNAGKAAGAAAGSLVGKDVAAEPGKPPKAVGDAGGKKAEPKAEPKKKMGSIERRNREIHGDDKIDALKQKNKDFQAAKKEKGGMDAFAKKYPNSNTAKERAKRNRVTSVMDMESYDFESREGQIALNVINVIADSMIHRGYTADDVMEYLNTESVESITEMYLNHDETIITESIIKEEFIDAQYEILNEGLWKGLATGFAKIAKPLVRGAKSLVGKGAGTAKQLTLPGTSRLALATSGVKSSVKNAVKPVAGLWSKIPGSVKGGAVGGVLGAKLAGGGKKGDTYNIYNYGSSGGSAKSSEKQLDKAASDVKKSADKKDDGYVQNYNKPSTATSASKSKGATPNAKGFVPKGAVSGSGTKDDPWKSKVTKTYVKNSYDLEPFDIVMEHLLSTEQAANVDEAIYIMSEMDSDAIQAIVNQK